MTTKELLQKARDLIADKKNWVGGSLRYDGRYCALGAVYAADGLTGERFIDYGIYPDVHEYAKAEGEDAETIRQAVELLDKTTQDTTSRVTIVDVNDMDGHAAVLDVFDTAIERATV